jgi:hypothetical protein
MVAGMGKIADVVNAYLYEPALASALQDARFEVRREHFWKQGENLK